MKFILGRELSFVSNRGLRSLPEAEAELLENLDLRAWTVTAKSGTGALSGLCHAPPLSADQEKLLFRRFNFLKFQATQLRSRVDLDRPDWSLACRLEHLLTEADRTMDVLVLANVRLVVSIVRRTKASGTSFDELVSDGLIALSRAVEKFDESRGFRFSTYATMVIRRDLFRSIRSAQNKHRRHLSVDRTDLAKDLEGRPAPRLSFEEWTALYTSLESMLDTLEPREREILHARFGYEQMEKKPSLRVLAERLGISKERVRQIERKALAKLRTMSDRYGLKRFEPPSGITP